MESSGFVQLAEDGIGKKVDSAELTRADSTVVERQLVVVGDPSSPEAPGVAVRGEMGHGVTLGELRIISLLERIDMHLESISTLLTLVTGDSE
jgi:hypothetical protein